MTYYKNSSYMTGLEIFGLGAVLGAGVYGANLLLKKLEGSGSGGHTTAHTAPTVKTIDSIVK